MKEKDKLVPKVTEKRQTVAMLPEILTAGSYEIVVGSYWETSMVIGAEDDYGKTIRRITGVRLY